MDFFVLDWSVQDIDDVCEIHAFGKSADGQSVVARITYYPYFFVKMPGTSEPERQLFVTQQQYRKTNAANQFSQSVFKYDAWGYNEHKQPFVQLAYDSLASMRAARRRLSHMEIFEGNVDPIIRLCHIRNIAPTGWVRVEHYKQHHKPMYNRSDVELATTFDAIGPSSVDVVPPLVVCSWDIEVYSHDGSFPSASVEENCIIQIASSFRRLDQTEPYRTVVVCLRETRDIDTGEVICTATEDDLLNTWIEILNDERLDIMFGWNTWQFDWRYIAGRQSLLTDEDGEELVDLTVFGRGGPGASVKSWELSSGAYGQNSYSVVAAPGVLDLDMMQLVKREHKLDSYALNAVANIFLGESKIDLPASDIFKKYRQGPAERAEIARYAVQDVLLPLRLFSKLNIFDNLHQMSVATSVPMEYLLTRGQQIKVFSLILRQARTMGYVLPDDKRMTIEGKYEGATVLDAKKGAYFDVISGLDFASLYPTIIRSYNMCYSTLLLPGSDSSAGDAETYSVETGLGTYTFVQQTTRKGIVPTLLENLATWRSDAKKKMGACKKAGDTFGASVWNGAQLAFKVSANSVYGFLGASKGFLPCVPIAASVTATGRLMIEKTKNMAMELVPGSEVVYGDTGALIVMIISTRNASLPRISDTSTRRLSFFTDSVMVRFNVPEKDRHNMHVHFRIAEDVAQKISETFPGCIELEFEKYVMCCPCLLRQCVPNNPQMHNVDATFRTSCTAKNGTQV